MHYLGLFYSYLWAIKGAILNFAKIFCCTSLPITSSRWVQSNIKLLHCPLSQSNAAVNKSQQCQIWKKISNTENRTHDGWVGSINTASVLCRSPCLALSQSLFYPETIPKQFWIKIKHDRGSNLEAAAPWFLSKSWFPDRTVQQSSSGPGSSSHRQRWRCFGPTSDSCVVACLHWNS